MGRFKRKETSVSGNRHPSAQRKKKPAPKPKRGRWINGVWVETNLDKKDAMPETAEEKFERKRACATIMARRFGIREWHRNYLTAEEIAGIEAERLSA
jgi:hypothetical protein